MNTYLAGSIAKPAGLISMAECCEVEPTCYAKDCMFYGQVGRPASSAIYRYRPDDRHHLRTALISQTSPKASSRNLRLCTYPTVSIYVIAKSLRTHL